MVVEVDAKVISSKAGKSVLSFVEYIGISTLILRDVHSADHKAAISAAALHGSRIKFLLSGPADLPAWRTLYAEAVASNAALCTHRQCIAPNA